jgi:hypothetical protein
MSANTDLPLALVLSEISFRAALVPLVFSVRWSGSIYTWLLVTRFSVYAQVRLFSLATTSRSNLAVFVFSA